MVKGLFLLAYNGYFAQPLCWRNIYVKFDTILVCIKIISVYQLNAINHKKREPNHALSEGRRRTQIISIVTVHAYSANHYAILIICLEKFLRSQSKRLHNVL